MGNVAKALNGNGCCRGVHAEVFHCFAHGEDHAKAGGFGAAFRAAAAKGFAGDGTGSVVAHEGGVLVHHPAHHLGSCANVRCRDVLAGTNILPHDAHKAAHQAFFFANREGGGIHHNAALTATQGDVGDSAFPGHPHRQSAHGIGGFIGRKAQTALIGTAGIVVLNAETLEDFDAAIIHAHRDTEVEFPRGIAQKISDFLAEFKLVGDFVELSLSHFKSVCTS